MRHPAVLLAAPALLGLTACIPPGARHARLQPIARLDCPDATHQLTRMRAAPDGSACDYTDASGGEVQLRLIKVSTSPDAALDPIEEQLKALVPTASPTAAGPATPPAPPAPPVSGDRSHNVDISLPGVSIHARDERAKVQVGGIDINADHDTDTVHIQGGSGPLGPKSQFTVDAHNGGAIIRSKAMGENVHASLIIASETPGPDGWRAVGYDAVGPKSGPLVVATIKARNGQHDDVFEAARRLVTRVARG